MRSDLGLRQARREYLESRILSAQPVVLVLMLYEVAIDSLTTALDRLAAQDAMGRAKEISKAQEAVNELTVALDHSAGAQFSTRLNSLYGYIQSEIIRGHVAQSDEAFRNALSVLRILSEAWAGVCQQVMRTQESREEPHQPSMTSGQAEVEAGYRAEFCSKSLDLSC